MKSYASLLFALLTLLKANGQPGKRCDVIYDTVDVLPEHKKGMMGIANYVMYELAPVVSDCMSNGDELIANLYITLTIDNRGQVIDAEFIKPALTSRCKNALKKKLLSMDGWTPAKFKGRAVCSHYKLPIGCLKWE